MPIQTVFLLVLPIFLVAEVGFFIARRRRIAFARRSQASSFKSVLWADRLHENATPWRFCLPTHDLLRRSWCDAASRTKRNRTPTVSCSFLVAEVGFEPHDLRVMRCRLSRKSFPQAVFQYFLIHLLGEMERSICFRVHLFHAVLFPYGSSYGSEICHAKRHHPKALFGSNEWVNLHPAPAQYLERI